MWYKAPLMALMCASLPLGRLAQAKPTPCRDNRKTLTDKGSYRERSIKYSKNFSRKGGLSTHKSPWVALKFTLTQLETCWIRITRRDSQWQIWRSGIQQKSLFKTNKMSLFYSTKRTKRDLKKRLPWMSTHPEVIAFTSLKLGVRFVARQTQPKNLKAAKKKFAELWCLSIWRAVNV